LDPRIATKNIEQKPSETALLAALHRALAHKDYQNESLGPDHLAEFFLPPHFRFFIRFKKVRENTRKKLHAAFPGVHEYIIARTAFFDRVFRDALARTIPQIVLLGAGYDSRACRYARLNCGTRVIELDIGPTQNRKKQCLKQARIHLPEGVSLVPIDFNRESIGAVLEKAGYENDCETLFLWEGVSYYLEAGAAGKTLELVSWAGHPESTIAFDYSISASEESLRQFGVKEFFQSMQVHHLAESLLFTIGEGETGSYLEGKGLKLVQHLDNQQIERQFLLDETGTSIGHPTANFRLALAKPS